MSKNKISVATLDPIRPITIFSPIYKIYELHIKDDIEARIWAQIDEIHDGFRRGQDNIIDG